MARRHEISSAPENMVWGYLDSANPPILTVNSGDTVTLHSFPAGGKETLPEDLSRVPADYLKALETTPSRTRSPLHHRPGLRARRAARRCAADRHPRREGSAGLGLRLDPAAARHAARRSSPTTRPFIPRIDRAAQRLPRCPGAPRFRSTRSSASSRPRRRRAWGRCGSPVPRAFGGNMDNKELRAGTTLYLPVFNDGALFFAGDGHAVQGDGEVCITALETGVTGTFRLTVAQGHGYQVAVRRKRDASDVDRPRRGSR